MALSADSSSILGHIPRRIGLAVAMVLALVGTLAVMAPQRALATPVLTTGTYHNKAIIPYGKLERTDFYVDVTSVDQAKGTAQMVITNEEVLQWGYVSKAVSKPITLDLRRSGTDFSFSFETVRGSSGTGTMNVLSSNVVQIKTKMTKFARSDGSLTTRTTFVCNKGDSLDGVLCRMYSRKSGEHFYTSSVLERSNLVAHGWISEGASWKSPTKSNTPVYRLYNANAGEHHYTMSKVERDHLVQVGWKDEGIGWYSDDAKGVTVYRVYNPNAYANNHHYTTSKHERDELIRLGWRDEGVAWCGQKV